MKISKAIIPVAGWGTRRLPITKVIEKSMLPVGNRPLVDYSVQELIKVGVTDIYMVVSSAEPCQVREFYSENKALTSYLTEREKFDRLELAKTLPDNVNIHYLPQDTSKRYGTAVPVAMVVEEFNIDEPVFVFMGDDFIWNPNGESGAESLLKMMSTSEDSVTLGVEMSKTEISKYGAISMEDGKMTSLVEKPKPEEAPSNLAFVNKTIMSPALLKEIVDYVHENDFKATDQEYMITDPIDSYSQKGWYRPRREQQR